MKKSHNEQSIESKFGEELGGSVDWAVSGGVFFHWEGSFWQARVIERTEETEDAEGVEVMKSVAYKWLKENYPAEASDRKSNELIKTAMLDCRRLPKANNRNIVPTNGCYLEICPDGKIQALQPERELGMTHLVNADIGIHQGVYTPRDLPSDSLFYHFLNSSLPQAEVREIVQEYVGYTLISSTKFQVGQLWLGEGRNGKSVLLEIVQALHAKTASMSLNRLTDFYLQPLVGASLACVSEVPKTGVDGEMFKSLIAGDLISVNRKHKDVMGYKPTAKWLMAANNLMKTNDHSDGWWRRLQIIPWSVQIPDNQLIPDLAEMVCAKELNLVLDWALQGVSRLLKRGLFDASSTLLTTTRQEAIEASNPVAAWLAEIEPVSHQIGMPKNDVFMAFRKWADDNNYRCPEKNVFWQEMRRVLKNRFEIDKRYQRQHCGQSVDYVRFAFGDALRNLEAPWDDDETPATEFIQPRTKPIQHGARF